MLLRNAFFGRRLQKKMLQGESDIKAGLTKFSLRVREATDALQTQLLAALRDEPGGAEEETPLAADLEQRDRVCTVVRLRTYCSLVNNLEDSARWHKARISKLLTQASAFLYLSAVGLLPKTCVRLDAALKRTSMWSV